MIVREGCEVLELLDTVESSRFLSEVNEEALVEYMTKCKVKEFKMNSTARTNPSSAFGPFEFWISHGIKKLSTPEETFTAVYPNHVMRFNNIESLFKELYQISDDEIVLKRDQEECYNQNPHKLHPYARKAIEGLEGTCRLK